GRRGVGGRGTAVVGERREQGGGRGLVAAGKPAAPVAVDVVGVAGGAADDTIRRGVPRDDRVSEHNAAGRDAAPVVVRDGHVGELDEAVCDDAAARVAADRAVHQRRRPGDYHAVSGAAADRAADQGHWTCGADPVPAGVPDGAIDHLEWPDRADPCAGAGAAANVAALDAEGTNAENPAPSQDRPTAYHAVRYRERPAVADCSPFIDR